MLDLQAAHHAASGSLSTSLNGSQPSVMFARIIGSIDASIGPDNNVDPDEDMGGDQEDIDVAPST